MIHPWFPGRLWGWQWSPRLLTLVGAQWCVLLHLPPAPLPCTWVPERENTRHTLPRCTLLYFQWGLHPESQPSSLGLAAGLKKKKTRKMVKVTVGLPRADAGNICVLSLQVDMKGYDYEGLDGILVILSKPSVYLDNCIAYAWCPHLFNYPVLCPVYYGRQKSLS